MAERTALVTRRSFLKSSALAAGSLVVPRLALPAHGATDPWADADAIVARIVVPGFPARDFNIKSYGAVAGGTTDCTAAVAKAIAACNAAGGGRVVVPSGTFLTGAIHLKSNVNLYVAAGAVLRFSTDPKKYLPVVLTSWEANDCYNYSPLIYAYRQTNIAVTGPGTLDGQGRTWWAWTGKAEWGWTTGMPRQGADSKKLRSQGESGVPVGQRVYGGGHYLRPHFIEPYGCTDVLIQGVTIKDSPFWTLHPLFSRSVTVRNVSVQSYGPNDDGCDPECCTDVLIHDCHFNTKDDNIAIKSGRGADGLRRATPSQNIVIRRIRVTRGGGAIAIGSEEGAGVHHVYVDGLTGDDARLSTAVLIKAMSYYGPGTVEHVYMRNVKLAGLLNSVVTLTYQYGGADGNGPYRPHFRDLHFSGFACPKSRHVLAATGLPDDGIGPNITMSDSTFTGVFEKPVSMTDATGIAFNHVTANGKPV